MADVVEDPKNRGQQNGGQGTSAFKGMGGDHQNSSHTNDVSDKNNPSPTADATNKLQDSVNARPASSTERQQTIEQYNRITSGEGYSKSDTKTTSDGAQLKGIDQYDKTTNQREFFADNGNGTYTRYSYKDDNTLQGPNGESISLKNKNQAQAENQQAPSPERANTIDAKPVVEAPKSNLLQTSNEVRQRESIPAAQSMSLSNEAWAIPVQAKQDKTQNLSADGVRVADKHEPGVNLNDGRVAPISNFDRGTSVPGSGEISNSQSRMQSMEKMPPSSHSIADDVTRKGAYSMAQSNVAGHLLEHNQSGEAKQAFRIEHQNVGRFETADTKFKADHDLGLIKKELLDPKGNQINVAPRLDVIDKINGSIRNTLGSTDVVGITKGGVSAIRDGATVILIAGARVIDGVKGSLIPGKKIEAAGNDKVDVVKGNPSQVRAAKLEDLRAITSKSPDAREQGCKIAQSILNNMTDMKLTGSQSAVADAMRQLSETQLRFVNKVLSIGLKPDFSKFDDKAQIKLTAVFSALAEIAKGGNSPSKQQPSEKNQSAPVDKNIGIGGKVAGQASDKTNAIGLTTKPAQRIDEKTNSTDARNSKIADRVPNPRGFIDSRLELLQNLGLLKPLKEVIAKVKDSMASLIMDHSQRQSKGGEKTPVRFENNRVTESKITAPQVARQQEMIGKLSAGSSGNNGINKLSRSDDQTAKGAAESKKFEPTRVQIQTKTQLSEAERQASLKQKEPQALGEKTRPLVSSLANTAESLKQTKTAPLALKKIEESGPAKENPHVTQEHPIIEFDPNEVIVKEIKEKKESNDLKPEKSAKETLSKEKNKRRTKLRCIVKEGDSLASISQRYFGEASYAAIIYHINKTHIQCVVFNHKNFAVLEPNTIITIPDDDDVLSYRESNTRYDDIDFGGILAAHVDAAKQKVLIEQANSDEQESTVKQIHNIQSEVITRQVNHGLEPQGPISERITADVKIIESECFSADEQGVRISLRAKHESQWVTVCFYEIYSVGSKRRQYYQNKKPIEKPVTLPPATVKTMANQDFRKNFKTICDEFFS